MERCWALWFEYEHTNVCNKSFSPKISGCNLGTRWWSCQLGQDGKLLWASEMEPNPDVQNVHVLQKIYRNEWCAGVGSLDFPVSCLWKCCSVNINPYPLCRSGVCTQLKQIPSSNKYEALIQDEFLAEYGVLLHRKPAVDAIPRSRVAICAWSWARCLGQGFPCPGHSSAGLRHSFVSDGTASVGIVVLV